MFVGELEFSDLPIDRYFKYFFRKLGNVKCFLFEQRKQENKLLVNATNEVKFDQINMEKNQKYWDCSRDGFLDAPLSPLL